MALNFIRHTIQRMFERTISEKDVESAIKEGFIVKEYPDDEPYPSFLVYHNVKNKPLHVVYAISSDESDDDHYMVITVYQPSLKNGLMVLKLKSVDL